VSELLISLLSDDGGVLYLNGVEIYRQNMPSGEIMITTTSSGEGDEDNFTTTTIDLASLDGGSPLVDGVNTLAFELHQTNLTSSDWGFDMRLSLVSPDGLPLIFNDNDRGEDITSVDAFAHVTVGPDNGTIIDGPHADGTFTYRPNTGFFGTDTFAYTITTAAGTSAPALVTITVEESQAAAQITGRHIFYENSLYDDPNRFRDDPMGPPTGEGANASDDSAIDTSKEALLHVPGNSASFVNYTNYTKGINGIMVDILGAAKPIELTDFTFEITRNGTSGITPLATLPTMTIREGEGEGGADRVTFTWLTATEASPVITERWLKVTVDEGLGLAADDVFYFGNQIAEGNGVSEGEPSTLVDTADIGGTRTNLHTGGLNTALVTDQWDFNKDGLVNTGDIGIVRTHQEPSPLGRLGIFTVPGPVAGPLSAGLSDDGDDGLLVGALTGGDGGWSDLGGESEGGSSSSGTSAETDERIWADEEDEDLVGAGASSVDAALEDDSDWLDSDLDAGGWELL
jgi:hypothetical protein